MEKSVAKLCESTTRLAGLKKNQLPQFVGSWSHHVLSWLDHPDVPVQVVRYEDLLIDPAAKLAEVLGFARPDERIDPHKIAKAVENSTFEKLQAAEDANSFREKPQRADRFFRKGGAGDWQNYLTSEQASRISKVHGAVMQRFGYAM